MSATKYCAIVSMCVERVVLGIFLEALFEKVDEVRTEWSARPLPAHTRQTQQDIKYTLKDIRQQAFKIGSYVNINTAHKHTNAVTQSSSY